MLPVHGQQSVLILLVSVIRSGLDLRMPFLPRWPIHTMSLKDRLSLIWAVALACSGKAAALLLPWGCRYCCPSL